MVVVLDEIIQIISRAVLRAGDNIVTAGATFPQYRHHAIIEGCEVKEIALNNGVYDLEEISSVVDNDTKLYGFVTRTIQQAHM